MRRRVLDGKRHVHVLLGSRDWWRFKRMLIQRRQQVSPMVRELILQELGREEKAEPRVQPTS
jgi:hypothetical protein